jgi:hypothetical protein
MPESPRSHSNLHLDIRRIAAANADFHDYQRSTADRINALRGTFPLDKPSMTLHNTPEYNRLNKAIPQLAYYRYRNRGGQLPFGEHTSDFRYISPNHHNMAPGSSYRHYFHRTVTRNYNSLGDATAAFNRKLRALRQEEAIPSATGPPDPHKDDQQPPHNHVRTQTHPQDVTTGPDDPTAVLDDGAMMTTIPTRLILGTPWEQNIHPAPPGTTIRYGNMEVDHIEQISTIGT